MNMHFLEEEKFCVYCGGTAGILTNVRDTRTQKVEHMCVCVCV